MTKHAPGPWFVNYSPTYRQHLHVVDSEGRRVAYLTQVDFDGETQLATATAIGALPDLLEAAETAKKLLRSSPTEAIRVLEAAIAKARGES